MALTEPDAGINTTSITTFASRDGEGWRLNGRKIWITAVPDSDKMLVIARTQRLDEVERKTLGISLFMIDVDREGKTEERRGGEEGVSTCSSRGGTLQLKK